MFTYRGESAYRKNLVYIIMYTTICYYILHIIKTKHEYKYIPRCKNLTNQYTYLRMLIIYCKNYLYKDIYRHTQFYLLAI